MKKDWVELISTKLVNLLTECGLVTTKLINLFTA